MNEVPVALPNRADRDVVLHTRVVTSSGGGPENGMLRASASAAPRYAVAVAFLRPPADPGFAAIEERARRFGAAVIGIDDRGPIDLRAARELLGWCRRLNVRIWHGHDYKSNLLGLLLRPFHPMKLVTTMHGWFATSSPRLRFYYAVDRLCLRRYDHVISVSSDLHAVARGLGLPERRCSLLPNGVDPRVFVRNQPPRLSPLRRQRGVPSTRLVIGAVGRLSSEKGFDDLIRSAETLTAAGIDLELWIAGDGDARRRLEAQIAAAGLHDRVKLLGFVEDTPELFRAFDVFVLSSQREAMPNALLEAMSTGLAAVATRVGGVPDLIADGENGLLCEARDARGLTGAIARLLADGDLRERLGREARKTVEEHFTTTARITRELDVYDRVLGIQTRQRT